MDIDTMVMVSALRSAIVARAKLCGKCKYADEVKPLVTEMVALFARLNSLRVPPDNKAA